MCIHSFIQPCEGEEILGRENEASGCLNWDDNSVVTKMSDVPNLLLSRPRPACR